MKNNKIEFGPKWKLVITRLTRLNNDKTKEQNHRNFKEVCWVAEQ